MASGSPLDSRFTLVTINGVFVVELASRVWKAHVDMFTVSEPCESTRACFGEFVRQGHSVSVEHAYRGVFSDDSNQWNSNRYDYDDKNVGNRNSVGNWRASLSHQNLGSAMDAHFPLVPPGLRNYELTDDEVNTRANANSLPMDFVNEIQSSDMRENWLYHLSMDCCEALEKGTALDRDVLNPEWCLVGGNHDKPGALCAAVATSIFPSPSKVPGRAPLAKSVSVSSVRLTRKICMCNADDKYCKVIRGCPPLLEKRLNVMALSGYCPGSSGVETLDCGRGPLRIVHRSVQDDKLYCSRFLAAAPAAATAADCHGRFDMTAAGCPPRQMPHFSSDRVTKLVSNRPGDNSASGRMVKDLIKSRKSHRPVAPLNSVGDIQFPTAFHSTCSEDKVLYWVLSQTLCLE